MPVSDSSQAGPTLTCTRVSEQKGRKQGHVLRGLLGSHDSLCPLPPVVPLARPELMKSAESPLSQKAIPVQQGVCLKQP